MPRIARNASAVALLGLLRRGEAPRHPASTCSCARRCHSLLRQRCWLGPRWERPENRGPPPLARDPAFALAFHLLTAGSEAVPEPGLAPPPSIGRTTRPLVQRSPRNRCQPL